MNDFSVPSSPFAINGMMAPSGRVAWILEAVRLHPEALRAITWALPDVGGDGMAGDALLRWVAEGPEDEAPVPEAVQRAAAALVHWDGPDWVRVYPDGRPIPGPAGARGRGLRALAEHCWGGPWGERMARPWGARGGGPLGGEGVPGLTIAILAPVFASLRSAAWQAAAVAERRLAEAADALEADLRAILGDPEADFPSPRDVVRYFFDDRPLAMAEWLLGAPEAAALRRWLGREAVRRGWPWRWRDLAAALRAFVDRQEELRRKGFAVLRGGPGAISPVAPPHGGADAPADDEAPGQGEPRRLADVWPWPGLPVEDQDALVPGWIRFEPEGTWLRRPSKEDGEKEVWDQIASGPVALLGVEADVDNRLRWLRLAWLDEHGMTECHVVPRLMVGRRQPDDTAVGLNMPVLVGKWRLLAESLSKWEAFCRTRGALATRLRVDRLGWVVTPNDIAVFVLPDGILGQAPGDRADAHLDRDRATTLAGFGAHGRFDEEREGIGELLVRFPRTAWVLGHAAAACGTRWWWRARVMEWAGYGVELVSDQTGVGKSFAIAAAMAPWGSPSQIRPLLGTDYALAEILYRHSDLPTALQEAQAETRANLPALIHALADGGNRVQGQRSGGIRPAHVLHGVMLMANNQSVVASSAQQGPSVRVLSTGPLLPILEDPTPIQALERLFGEHHGHGGRRAIQWLLDQTGGVAGRIQAMLTELWDQAFADVRCAIADLLATMEGEPHAQLQRMAKAAACGLVGLRMLAEGYGWETAFRSLAESGYMEVLRTVAQEWAWRHQTTWRRALETLGHLLSMELHRIAGTERRVNGAPAVPADGYIGAWKRVRGETGPCIAINPEWVRRELGRALGDYRDFATLTEAWAREGVLLKRRGGGAGARALLWQYRLPQADGQVSRPKGWMFRARTPNGWVWAPVPDGGDALMEEEDE